MTEGLAADFGRDVRNIIGSAEYRAIFDTRLAEDNQLRWALAHVGRRMFYAMAWRATFLAVAAICC